MRIAFILPKLTNQGPIIVAKDIIDNIKDYVELVDVYFFDDVVEFEFDCNVYKIDFLHKIDFNKYDVIHSHMLRPDFYIWYHREKGNTPLFVSTLHQNIYDNLKGNYNAIVAYLFEKIWLYLLRKQDIVVTLTDLMKSFYTQRTHLNFRTIYNGRNCLELSNSVISSDDLNLIEQLKRKFIIIGVHCLLTKRKGLHQIIQSLVYLNDYAFIIIGNGKELEELKRRANDLGVGDRCFFFGYRVNAVAYLKYFDVYVMSSYSEGFPLGLLEAGLSNLPIVCSDIPIFRELFTESEVCFFELDNINSLSKSIEISYARREDFSKAILRKINERYSVTKMAKNYLELYNC